ncbi:MAG: DNA adenine methylase, partial [Bacilli bacterium]|nr:DNA adenine methylase [Bacilli bacterium]
MRYIGSKANLLKNIENVINENIKEKQFTFCDLFSGTSIVGEYFKKDYEIISNDLMYFSYVIQKAKIENNSIPKFEKLKKIGILDPINYLEDKIISEDCIENNKYFITQNYSPYKNSKRMYLSVENAMRID